MDVSTVIAIGGVALLVIGLLGGGIELQSIKVSPVPARLRILASITGIILILAGVMLSPKSSSLPILNPGSTDPTSIPAGISSPTPTETSILQATSTETPVPSLPTDTLTPPSSPQPDYAEDFTNGTTLWPINNMPNNESTTEKATVIDGVYRWEIQGHKSIVARVKPDLPPVSDFEFQVDVRLVSGPEGMQYGVSVRMNPAGSYRFLVDTNGRFRFLSYEIATQTWTDLIQIRTISAYKQGVANTFKIVAEGSRIRSYINDQLVADVTNEKFSTGDFGVDADFHEASSAILEIDNFQLTIK